MPYVLGAQHPIIHATCVVIGTVLLVQKQLHPYEWEASAIRNSYYF